MGALLLVALPGPASAQEDGFSDDDGGAEGTGPELSVRTGYGVARGKGTPSVTLQERFSGALPIGIDLGYRVHPRWFVGGYGEYAIGFNSSTAEARRPDATHTWLHLSLQVQYRLLLGEQYDVWVGAGTGRQWFNMTLNREAQLTQTLTGPEYFNLQFGGSWSAIDGIAVGPYSTVSVGSFSEGVERCGEDDLCVFPRRELDLGSLGAHLWFTTGVRIVFLP